jgi:hypothetical protein
MASALHQNKRHNESTRLDRRPTMTATIQAKEPIDATLPLEDLVRQRAYELYLIRGNESGSELDDWLQAEREILLGPEPAGA